MVCVRLAVNGVPDAVEAQYVIAADGASSPMRRHLGIEMNGPRELARFVAMYFHADLSEWTEGRPAVLYWIVNPEAQGVFIALDGHSRWTFHLRIDPEKEAFEDFTPERCLEVLAEAIGGPLPAHRSAPDRRMGHVRPDRPALSRRPGLARGRCGTPVPADRRIRDEHRNPGCAQPCVEDRRGAQWLGFGVDARHLRVGASACRGPEPQPERGQLRAS